MLHGKHVMVRVGGGWDTLKGFLLKYDPGRVLKFTTLEQKILAYQKGTSVSGCILTAPAVQPPSMDPLAAVNLLPKSSASSSQSSIPYSKPGISASGIAMPRGVTRSPATTPSLPHKAAVPKRKLQVSNLSPKTKINPFPIPQASPPVSLPHKVPLTSLNLKQYPRNPVCPEPNCKQPKPSTTPVTAEKVFQQDCLTPRAPLNARLAPRRPSSPGALRLQRDARKGRPVSPRPVGLARSPRETKPLVKSQQTSKKMLIKTQHDKTTVKAKTTPQTNPLLAKTQREVKPTLAKSPKEKHSLTKAPQVVKSTLTKTPQVREKPSLPKPQEVKPLTANASSRHKVPAGQSNMGIRVLLATCSTSTKSSQSTHSATRKAQTSSTRPLKPNTTQNRVAKPISCSNSQKQVNRTAAPKKAEKPYFEMSNKKKQPKSVA